MNSLKQVSIFLAHAWIVFILWMVIPTGLNAESGNVTAHMVPFFDSLEAGEEQQLAVVFSMQPGWHIYWKNPGEAGIPTRFNWSLPAQFELLDMEEPVPERHVDDGITSFIHEGEAIYVFTFRTPNILPETSTFHVTIDWLECKSLCQVGADTLLIEFPKGGGSDQEDWQFIKQRAESQFPQRHNHSWQVKRSKDRIELWRSRSAGGSGELMSVVFFPLDEMIFDLAQTPILKKGLWKERVRLPLSDYRMSDPDMLRGVLVETYHTPEGVITVPYHINTLL